MGTIVALMACLCSHLTVFSQWVIPPERRGTWENAGYSPSSRTIPRQYTYSINITTFGGHGDGLGDNTNALNAAINYCASNNYPAAVILFPAGTYRFESQIDIGRSGIVLRGAGSNQTIFKFNATNLIVPLVKVEGKQNVGIENLLVMRDPFAGNQTHNFEFIDSQNCWVQGVESQKTGRHHINISGGNSIVVKGCFFTDAEIHTGGGYGYGVNVTGPAYNCLIEDNIFRQLRHAIVFQFNAHDNVAGYNYAREGHARRTEGGITYDYQETDITCHGSGNYNNLVEGNVVDILGVDNINGATGPNNTIFRNAILKDWDILENPLDERSRFIDAPNLNMIGNLFIDGDDFFAPVYEGSTSSTVLDVYAKYGGTGHGTHQAKAQGLLDDWLWVLRDHSFYYVANATSPPNFLNVLSVSSWPAIGPKRYTDAGDPFPYDTNAAEQRWYNSQKKTVDAPPIILPLSVSISGAGQAPCATGTWTAMATGGIPPYSYHWYHMWACEGGGGEIEMQTDDPIVNVAPCTWNEVGANSATLQFYLCCGDSYLRVDVTDAANTTVSTQRFIPGSCGGSFAESASPDVSERGSLEKNSIPDNFAVFQNFPNPFNPETEIRFDLPEPSSVRLAVMDVLGRELAVLNDRELPAGYHMVRWNGQDQSGRHLSSGVYFCRLAVIGRSGMEFAHVLKMTLTR